MSSLSPPHQPQHNPSAVAWGVARLLELMLRVSIENRILAMTASSLAFGAHFTTSSTVRVHNIAPFKS